MWDLSEIGNYIKVKYHLCFSVITFKNSSIVMNDGKSLPSFYQIKNTCESIQMLDRVARGYGRLLWETVGEKKKRTVTIVSQLSIKIRFLKMTTSFHPIGRQWSESSAEMCALAA